MKKSRGAAVRPRWRRYSGTMAALLAVRTVAAASSLWVTGQPCDPGVYVADCLKVEARPALLNEGGPSELDLAFAHGKVLRVTRMDSARPPGLPGYLLWEGRVRDDPFSNVTFARAGSALVGYVSTSTGPAYRVRRGPGDSLQAETLDGAALMGLQVNDQHACAMPAAGQPVHCDVTGAYPIDVLLLITPDAEREAGSRDELSALIMLEVGRTNQSFSQSNIRHRLRIAGIKGMPGYATTTSVARHLENLENPANGLESVPDMRRQTGADLTIMLVSAADPPLSCELPRETVGNRRFADHANSVVPVSLLAVADLFAHEVGHLLGAGHALSGGIRDDSHGMSYKDKRGTTAWKTLMVRDGGCSDCPGILYWSTPTVRAPGRTGTLGIAGKYDNAATINATGCTVSKFRETPPAH